MDERGMTPAPGRGESDRTRTSAAMGAEGRNRSAMAARSGGLSPKTKEGRAEEIVRVNAANAVRVSWGSAQLGRLSGMSPLVTRDFGVSGFIGISGKIVCTAGSRVFAKSWWGEPQAFGICWVSGLSQKFKKVSSGTSGILS